MYIFFKNAKLITVEFLLLLKECKDLNVGKIIPKSYFTKYLKEIFKSILFF